MVYSKFTAESKHNHGANLNIKSKARDLRKNMTEAEKALWKKLRNNQIDGVHFRRQHPYHIYIIDFYCHKANLAIEIDGKIHLKRLAEDKLRTEYLESSGIKVLRFNNEDVNNRIDFVIGRIKEYIENNYPNHDLPTTGKDHKSNHFPPGGNKKGGK